MIDSLKLYEMLKSVDLSEPQARAITEAIGFAADDLEAHHTHSLATKADAGILSSNMDRLEAQFRTIDAKFDRIEAVLSAKIDASKVETIRWVIGLGVTLTAICISLIRFSR
jgi:hypothetical protein